MDTNEPEQTPDVPFPPAPFPGAIQHVLVLLWTSHLPSRRPSLPVLPTPLTPLVGREQAVAAVCAQITHPEVHLLTLTGTGGVGKTRVALAAAHAVQSSFADGVAFVDLSAVHDPAQVLPTLTQTLGLHTGTHPPLTVLQAALQHSQFLLLLDTFEQVLAAAPLLTDLLRSCPGVRLLVTSREPLRVEGEHAFPVPALPLPREQHTGALEELEANPAVRLFVQRARATHPTFQLTRANAATVVAICRQLEGIPLALELAATRIKLFSPQALLAHLEHLLHFLVVGPRSAPPRQQTLRQTIAWSYALLSEQEQVLFRRLCVFAGSWTLSAVEAVVAALGGEPTDVAIGLGALLDKHLILLDGEEEDPRRLRLLFPIRAFGLECLQASGEEEQVRLAHAQSYLAWAQGYGMTPHQVLQSRHEAAPDPAPPPSSGTVLAVPSALVPEQESMSLSRREREVLRLLAQGRTNAQIADQLVVSPFTVKAYVRAIYKKLGMHSRAAATRFALEHHLL